MAYIMEAYDRALEQILRHGEKRPDRTGVGTISIFGCQTRYRINEYFPVLTRRKVWPKAVFAELLWILSGSTNNQDLVDLGAKFWTPWVSRDFEAAHGFGEGDLGPVYGFQLRHFDGAYPTGRGGTDQLLNLLEGLRTDPYSRRHVISYWNPNQLDQMRLPPCHYTFQVYVDAGNRLSGMLTQRSADYPLGVPANIQFYSALVYMLAQQTNLEPYELVHNTGDSHIYLDQVPAVEQYLATEAPDSPRLRLQPAPDITSYRPEDFELLDYHPAGPIRIPVAV